MADYTFEDGAFDTSQRNVASMANWAGAVVSLALVAGIGVWGYKMIARDVSGVPIVAAMDGPMRVAPVDPGGQLADHQGLAVNEVAGQGTAAAPADRLVLAPRPAGLSEEDVAAGALIETAPPMPLDASLAEAAVLMEIEPEEIIPEDQARAPTEPVDPGDAAMADLVAELTGTATPLSDLEAEVAPVDAAWAELAADAGADAAPAVPVTAALGLGRSLRPQLRPAGLRTASLTALSPEDVIAAPAADAQEIDPDTLEKGTRLVQIGAFDSPEVARAEWARMQTRFGDYMDGKARVIQRASSGGRVFYRLRAHGFEDLSDARRFCAAFVAGQVDCIPVVTR